MPHLSADQVEDAIAAHYSELAISADLTDAIEQDLTAFMADRQPLTHELRATLIQKLNQA